MTTADVTMSVTINLLPRFDIHVDGLTKPSREVLAGLRELPGVAEIMSLQPPDSCTPYSLSLRITMQAGAAKGDIVRRISRHLGARPVLASTDEGA